MKIIICPAVLAVAICLVLVSGQGMQGSKSSVIITHLPIRIDSDADFTAANGVTSGNGTQSDPWTIEGWDISGHGYGFCIYIGNTTQHFVIRDCLIHDARQNYVTYYSTESGIILHRVSNGTVTGNRVYSNDFDGVYLHNSSHMLVEDNIATGNRWGVMLMDSSSNNTITGNIVNASTDYGIGLIDSAWNIVDGNNVSQNANMGIFLGGSVKNAIIRNIVRGGIDGINLDMSDGNTVCENNVTGNSGHGIYLWGSVGNRIFHNNIIDNPEQAYDDMGANSWDDGFPSGGNHWADYTGIDANSDGIGDSAYVAIPGGMAARDRYPFMERWFADAESPVADAGPDTDVAEGTLVTFDGSASADNVGVAVYTWTFDCGGIITLNGKNPEHNFTAPGIYLITLEVMDPAGNIGTDAMAVTVADITAPVADAGPDRSVGEGTIVILNGSASHDNVGIVDYQWNFKDGTDDVLLSGIVCEHRFTVAGAFQVTLSVTDAVGLGDEDVMTVTVSGDDVPPVADAGPDLTAKAGDSVIFNGTASMDNFEIADYAWTFSYNSTEVTLQGATPIFTFWAPGNYSVILTVTDGSGNSACDTVEVAVAMPETQDIPADVPSDEETDLNATDRESSGWVKLWPAMVAVEIVICLTIALAYLRWRKRPGKQAGNDSKKK